MSGTDWESQTVTVRAAYVAMVKFLERYYQMTGADDIGALLGGLSLLPDGDPADAAYKTEWLEVVAQARSIP